MELLNLAEQSAEIIQYRIPRKKQGLSAGDFKRRGVQWGGWRTSLFVVFDTAAIGIISLSSRLPDLLRFSIRSNSVN